jgi:hypothetical protein
MFNAILLIPLRATENAASRFLKPLGSAPSIPQCSEEHYSHPWRDQGKSFLQSPMRPSAKKSGSSVEPPPRQLVSNSELCVAWKLGQH